ncbi:AbiJ-NTD4 domain-containing protein [Legionella maceachernii]|uniref:HEPN AbiJ-N-terminal domain-containing protein n=1 Tax=Legionella maceachernii TaxID=466 RepID=A0A0W0VYH1_9GAMM|nr:hypothetical protein [Legionella maceachernii]KTD25148.1 hypothetical protein Lmac_2126 [Legionella maceachernii]SKA27311.1 hypothetical protein SAMN02745128_02961 [Legionella maceachernii]SUP04614.1 Uncharacterised protein [Legionella maceachernii]
MSGFSERNGLITKPLQKNEINDQLKNRLWSLIYTLFTNQIIPEITGYDHDHWSKEFEKITKQCWGDFFFLQMDMFPYDPDRFIKRIKLEFFNLSWEKIYDLLEFFAKNLSNKKSFIFDCNQILEQENSAYRFVDTAIVEIISQKEIESLECSLTSPYWQVNEHINKAIGFLSNRLAPDFKNCVKESVSAVEALAKIITKKPNGTLGKLAQNPNLKLPNTLQEAIKKIYGFASDKGGVRHANKDEAGDLTYHDALFIAITCSAIINYIIQLQNKNS